MIQIRALVASAAFLLCAGSARSEPPSRHTVQNMLDFCKHHDDAAEDVCVSIIYGMGTAMLLNGIGYAGSPPTEIQARAWLKVTGMCLANGETSPSGGAMVQAFINWANAHPTKWGEEDVAGIADALSSTWPCR